MDGPTLDAVRIATDGWKPYSLDARDRAWFDPGGDPVRVRLFDRPSPETTIDGWRERGARETAAGGGAVVSFDEVELDGLPGFRGVFKYPAAGTVPGVDPGSLAVYAVGMIAVPLGGWHLQLNTEAIERGQTGTREALYGVLNPPPPSDEPPRQLAGAGELFDRVRETLAMVLPSDAEEHDGLAPHHPLSRVRAMQRALIESIEIGAELRALR